MADCEFYYYNSGYCCKLKKLKTDNEDIDYDTAKFICWGYRKDECEYYKEKERILDGSSRDSSSSSTGCFLSSACIESKGLEDDCYDLSVLRGFRDGYLRSTASGGTEIEEYYRIAPIIVDTINKRSDAKIIYDEIYTMLVKPCVELIEQGKNGEAHAKYREFVLRLKEQFCS